MRRGCLALFAASLVACFSPSVDTDTESNDATDGEPGTSSGPPSEPTTTEDPGSASTGSAETGFDETDTSPTGPDDAPPQFESFTVNGSDTPAEVNEGGSISLEASVSDDLGIASVEFFDGRTSLGIVDTPPYELDVLVSSADSGSHTYRAVATDTGDQSAESEGVMLSINIVGGELEHLREELFDGADAIGRINGGLDASLPSRVILNAIEAGNETSVVIGYDSSLSLVWNEQFQGDLMGFRPAALGGEILVGSRSTDNDSIRYRSLDPATGAVSSSLMLPISVGGGGVIFGMGRVSRLADDVVVGPTEDSLAGYGAGLESELWTTDQEQPLDTFPSLDALFLTFGSPGSNCANGTSFCIRKLSRGGQTLWTTGLPFNDGPLVAARPDGGAFAVAATDAGGIDLARLDAAGAIEETSTLFSGERYYISAAYPDGQGGLLLCGAQGEYAAGQAVALRVDAAGTVLWEQRGFFNAGAPSAALDIVRGHDAVYVYGLSGVEAEFLGAFGDAWVARLTL